VLSTGKALQGQVSPGEALQGVLYPIMGGLQGRNLPPPDIPPEIPPELRTISELRARVWRDVGYTDEDIKFALRWAWSWSQGMARKLFPNRSDVDAIAREIYAQALDFASKLLARRVAKRHLQGR
jgi:hypothetical protein